MNIQHLRYAVEVDNAHSITTAAEKLFMSQPNLSRAIRELEGTLGFTLFNRTPRGIVPTARGEEFLHYARSILSQFDEMVARYDDKQTKEPAFRLSVPRASYIAAAFARFAAGTLGRVSLDYKETNALRAIRNVCEDGYDLGIVRYQVMYEKYFHDTFREKGLHFREIWAFRYLITLRGDLPLAEKPVITREDLEGWMELAHGDTYVPSLPQRELNAQSSNNAIHIYDRASQFELLSTLPKAFMWSSPIPLKELERYGLVQRPGAQQAALNKDVLIFQKQYMLSPLGENFLQELENVRKSLIALPYQK